MVYSTQYISTPYIPVSSSINLYTNTLDKWSYIYYPSNDSSTIYSILNNDIGNSKASILLIQETL